MNVLPWGTSFADYFDGMQHIKVAGFSSIVEVQPVANDHGWNLTCLKVATTMLKTVDGKVFENRKVNISTIEVFAQRKNVSHAGIDMNGNRDPEGLHKSEYWNGSKSSLSVSIAITIASRAIPAQLDCPPDSRLSCWKGKLCRA